MIDLKRLALMTIALAVVSSANNCLYGTIMEPENVSLLGEWGYGVDNGPLTWGRLSANNSSCRTGTSQSPIDIGN
jgi:carbonic anhydrase